MAGMSRCRTGRLRAYNVKMPSRYFILSLPTWFAERFGAPTRCAGTKLAGNRRLASTRSSPRRPGQARHWLRFWRRSKALLRQAVDNNLPDETQVVYVSPLKALSNDIHRNLQVPLEEIRAAALAAGLDPQPIRVAVRTGDTPQSERQAMVRKAPHILVTTPESLYLLLTSSKSREILRNVRTVIVDEIHALARDKRGSHLSLSLARLDQLVRHAADANRPFGNAASRSMKSRGFSWVRTMSTPTASRGVRSSIRGTCASWIWRSKCRRANCRPCARSKPGRRFTRGSAS